MKNLPDFCKMCGDPLTEKWTDRLMYCRQCRESCGNFRMDVETVIRPLDPEDHVPAMWRENI